MSRRLASLAALVIGAIVALPGRAWAQQYLIGASGELATGIEGGGAGMDLARARLRLGLDLRVDEFPTDIFGVGLLIELLPHSSFGLDARYTRAVGSRFEVNAGGIAIVAPESLFGPSAGLKYRLPFSTATRITLGPEANVFVIGSDLPSGTIIWQVLLQGGIHAISRPAVLVGALVAVCAHVVTSCLPPGDCQRNTDCDQGLTCVAGKCAGDGGTSDAAPQDAADSSTPTETGGDAATGGVVALDAGEQS